MTRPRSVHWHGWNRRVISRDEAFALAEGDEPIWPPHRWVEAPLFPRILIAARLRRFFQQHPELPDSVRLDLCCLLPFHPRDLKGRRPPDTGAALFSGDGDLGEVLASHEVDVGADAPVSRHPELSVVASDTDTVSRPVGRVHTRAGGAWSAGEVPAESLLSPEDAQLLREAIAAARPAEAVAA